MSSSENPPAENPTKPPVAGLLAAIIDSSDDAIFSKDLQGIVTSWNFGAERVFGYASAEMIGRPARLLLPLERHGEEQEILRRVSAGERVEHFETVRLRKDGRLVDVSITISPIRTETGVIVGASNVSRDITEQKRGRGASAHLAAIVSSSEDAIISKNLHGVITSWNHSAELLFGYTAAEMIGESVLRLVPEARREEEPKILERLRRGDRVDHFETIRRRKDGKEIAVSLTISPVKDENGRVIGASKIVRDITELRRITAEREQLLHSERVARGQAEHANRMKDEFLSTISHELRTPLNAIVGWIQVLKETEGLVPAIEQGLDVIERNAHAQAQLIDDLLDLGRIASGKMTLEVQPVDLALIAQEVVSSVKPAADQKGIRIRTILDGMRGAMMGDRKRLQQVVWNLVSNSIKFTPKGGNVVVTLARVNSHVEIIVSDSGKGIAKEFLPFVFDRFRQADASTTREFGGLGIGLALVRQLVELHGGTVRADSPGPNLGSTFSVSLPIAATSAQAEPHGTEEQSAVELPDGNDLRGIRILAVDDDPDSLEVVKRILSARGAFVETADSAELALERFASFNPHVVLSDVGMPVMDGYELIRRIRQIPGAAVVPAAALTALARSQDRMRALQAGFQTHVAKPIAPLELVAVVRSLATLNPAFGAMSTGTPN